MFLKRPIFGRLIFAWLVPLLAALPLSAALPTFSSGASVGEVSTYDISEASGLVASRQNPGVLWTANDSSFAGRLFALATNGQFLATLDVPEIFYGNFEDLALGPGPDPRRQYLYLGDIGDNFLARDSIRVIRFPEPAVYAHDSNSPVALTISGAQVIELTYPDGKYNCEAMMVDPLLGDLYLVTKHTNTARLYQATRAALDSGGPVELSFLREVDFRSVSAGDISPDGSLILIRRPGRGGLWSRAANESVDTAPSRAATTVPVIGQPTEPNGESIAWEPSARGYFTLSEGFVQPIYFFARNGTLPSQPRVLIPPAAEWEYLDTGEPGPEGWQTNTNGNWPKGFAPLGYGGGERTPVFYGDDLLKFPTTYFRKQFRVTGSFTNLALRVAAHDGFAVYLNGAEVWRRNLPSGAAFDTLAAVSRSEQFRVWESTPLAPALLRSGTNVLAVELHRADESGPSLNFDLQLVEARLEPMPRLATLSRTNGQYRASVTGPTGALVQVQGSTNLILWETERALVLTNGAGAFSTPVQPGPKYFRVTQ